MTKGRFLYAVVTAVGVAAIVPFGFQALEGAPQQSGPTIGQALVVRQTSARTGLPSFAGTDGDGLALPVSANLPAESRALAFLGLHGREFGLDRAGVQLQRAPTVDLLGVEHVRFQQVHMGVPVTAGQFLVRLRGSRVVGANGNVLTDLPADVTPVVTADAAIEQASRVVSRYRGSRSAGAQYGTPRLEIFNKGMLTDASLSSRLAWFVEATGQDLREFVWVDAKTGGILLNFSQLAHAKNRQTYDSQSTSVRPGVLMRSEGQPNIGDADVDNAHNYAGDTYDYFFNNFGRDSYNGTGGALISSVRFCPSPSDCPYANAFWDGNQMTYGAGFSQADDVVAHELTHAVTEYTAGLLYYYQSGALNESFSDMFGESVDLTNSGGTDTPGVRWLMGEDVPGFGAIRNMMNPNAFGDPGKVGDAQFFCNDQGWTDPFGDSGGVHINSGVPNHAFALMADGGTFNGRTINGIGLQKAGLIWYFVLENLLTSGATFADAYHAVRETCTLMIGVFTTAQDCTQVTLALDAVELQRRWNCGAAVQAPPLCPTGDPPLGLDALFDFESGDPEFTKTSTTATNWGPILGYAKGGLISEYGPNIDTISDHRVTMTNAVALPAGARLYFDHSFEFETFGADNFDGGVVEYSVDGVNWVDANSLVDGGRAYNGSLAPGDNPLGTRPAFVRQSFGYTGTRLNLASLAGQNVRFRWRVGTDSIIGSLGWFLDNIQIYTCAGPSNGEMITNGSFSGGTAPWQVFGLPTTPQGIVFDNTNNRFNYYRPPGSGQGVVFQQTGLEVPGGTAVEAVWTMANTDAGSLRKRYSVIIGEGDGPTQFSDMHVCTFWLDPGQSTQTYRMRTFTSKNVLNMTIWFYAATVNGAGNTTTYQLDNVSMLLKPTHSSFKTDCEDPLRPLAGGATSGNLILNPDFTSGESNWIRTGNLAGTWNPGGWADFFKLAGFPPGVILQQIAQPIAQDQRILATFQLGNSSGVRQRVTVIINEPGFSDMSACTFWLPPGLPLQTFQMRSYANIAWANAMLSVYPATVGSSPSHQWLRLDNVTFVRSTGSSFGTDCYDPGS